MSFDESVEALADGDPRYHRDAYHFLREALDFTQREIVEPGRKDNSHVTPAELLEGVRRYALKTYGPMAGDVLREWGIRSCRDVGTLVFRLAEAGCFAVTETDRPEDFGGGYDFEEAFAAPFRPRGGAPAAAGAARPA